MFKLRMNAASEGDALVLTWGTGADLHNAVVDLGRKKDYQGGRAKYEALGNVELLVVSHVDADHIEGAIPLCKQPAPPFEPGDVWYNGHHHLVGASERMVDRTGRETLGALQGEKLSFAIGRFGWPWNTAFRSRIASTGSKEASGVGLAGGLVIKLLSPDDSALAALIPRWEAELARAGLRPLDPDEGAAEPGSDREILSTLNVEALAARPYREDKATPNGSSIAFLAEYDGKRVLLAADAHPRIVCASLRAMGYNEGNRCKLDCYKVSHHGSRANTSPEMLRLLDCTTFAISTDGTRHGHPDPELVARILVADPKRHKKIFFNFRQPNTEVWDRRDLMDRYNYSCVFPDGDSGGINIPLD
ncbi:hypothetical protein ASG47_07020 [Devosia sp. Leaf420]|uniref:ComEC/Rec2 family competence protein n=1 Tax=Devosia sp. Leaf420 TaxID=1736374 RepID=UPI000714D4D9|nr:hypothetical protein [Devosia sp. Leaf420]KQT48120.1 hypothetical protein ASG47_07020 [Devosia sp. Leaf420]